jgi:ATP-dependent helicase/nuclease subunit B
VDGAPTVPSRWLLRIKALLDGLGLRDALAPDRPWLGWARAKELTEPVPRISAPSPCPAIALRPRRLSVSDIERWITNPYAIFARHILRLEPLPLLGAEPSAALRGAIVHEALRRFAKDHPEQVPEDVATLLALADQILTEYTGNPRIAAFWVPRLERFAHWFASTEPGRRAGVARVLAEVSGSYVLSGPAGPFTLTARADRVDICPDGIVITDYKTGSKNSIERLAKRAREGLAPQLPLEALIAVNGGFAGVQATRISKLRYISASGGEPPGSEVAIDQNIEAIIEATRNGLERLIARFDNPSTPYRAVRRPAYDYRYDDYKHLARVSEWIGAEAEGGGDE